MTEKERAAERFVAQEAENLGKTQCHGCAHFVDFQCKILPAAKARVYMGNSEKCPYKQNID